MVNRQSPVRVLVVDDDPDIALLIQVTLRRHGFEVDVTGDGMAALQAVRRHPPDLIVLDWQLPGLDGVDVCRRLRQSHELPIIMLTANAEVQDRIKGLDAGANDYVIKPVDPEELAARVRAQLRGRMPTDQDYLAYEELRLSERTHEVSRGERPMSLAPREYALLRFFMEHPEVVLGRERLITTVWGYDFDGEDNILDVYVRYLRQKLEAGGEPRLIQTVRGIGYVLRRDEA